MAAKKPGVIALFDVDGTLTAPRKEATQELLDFIRELRNVCDCSIVPKLPFYELCVMPG